MSELKQKLAERLRKSETHSSVHHGGSVAATGVSGRRTAEQQAAEVLEAERQDLLRIKRETLDASRVLKKQNARLVQAVERAKSALSSVRDSKLLEPVAPGPEAAIEPVSLEVDDDCMENSSLMSDLLFALLPDEPIPAKQLAKSPPTDTAPESSLSNAIDKAIEDANSALYTADVEQPTPPGSVSGTPDAVACAEDIKDLNDTIENMRLTIDSLTGESEKKSELLKTTEAARDDYAAQVARLSRDTSGLKTQQSASEVLRKKAVAWLETNRPDMSGRDRSTKLRSLEGVVELLLDTLKAQGKQHAEAEAKLVALVEAHAAETAATAAAHAAELTSAAAASEAAQQSATASAGQAATTIAALEAEIAAARQQSKRDAKVLSDELAATQSKLSSTRDALSKVQAEKQTQATELKRLQGFKQEHTAATEQLKQVVATLTADNEEMSRKFSAAQTSIETMQKAVRDATDLETKLQGDLRAAEQRIREASEGSPALQQELQRLKLDSQKMKGQLTAAGQTESSLIKKQAALEKQLAAAVKRAGDQQAEMNRAKAVAADAEARLSKAQAQLDQEPRGSVVAATTRKVAAPQGGGERLKRLTAQVKDLESKLKAARSKASKGGSGGHNNTVLILAALIPVLLLMLGYYAATGMTR